MIFKDFTLNKDKKCQWDHNTVHWYLKGFFLKNQFCQTVLYEPQIYCRLQNTECSLWVSFWDKNPSSFQKKLFDHWIWTEKSSFSIEIISNLILESKIIRKNKVRFYSQSISLRLQNLQENKSDYFQVFRANSQSQMMAKKVI